MRSSNGANKAICTPPLYRPIPATKNTHTTEAHTMTYCLHCGHQIHPAAPSCLQCGVARRMPTRPSSRPQDPLWLPLSALVCGLLAAAALLSPTPWSGLQTITAGPLMVAAVAIGCIALARQERGQALDMAGVALGAVGLMGAMAAHLF